MEKSLLKYLNIVLMGVSFAIVAFTGLLIKRGTWSLIHKWAGIVFIILALLHFILHWNWLIYMTKNIFFKKIK